MPNLKPHLALCLIVCLTLVACGQPGGPDGRMSMEPAPVETPSAYTVPNTNTATSTNAPDAPNQRIVENTKAFFARPAKRASPTVAYDSQIEEEGFLNRAFAESGFGRTNDGRIRIGLLLPLGAEKPRGSKNSAGAFQCRATWPV